MYRKIITGKNIYYVNSSDCYAVIANRLYYNGKKADDGTYMLDIDNGNKIILNVSGGVVY